MGIFKNIRSAFRALVGAETATLDDPKLLEWLGIDASGSRKAINEATYFTCLKMLSETMGKLPLKFYQQTERGRIPCRAVRGGADTDDKTESIYDARDLLDNG